MSAHEETPRQNLSEEELLLAIEKELEISMTQEIQKISEEKSQQKGGGLEDLPSVPDFRPSFEETSIKKDTSRTSAPKKRKSSSQRLVNFCIFFLVLASVVASFFLLYLLFYKGSAVHPGNSDGSSENALTSGSVNVPFPDHSSADAMTSGSASSEDIDPPVTSGGPTLEFPTEGYSSRDVTLTVDLTNDETHSEDGALLFTVAINTPTVQYPTNPAAEIVINAYIQELISSYQEDAKKKAAEYVANFSDNASPGSYEVFCSVLAAKSEILTLSVTVNAQIGGAAPLITVDCYNFNARTGEIIPLEEAVSDTAALASLSISHVDSSLVWEEVYRSFIKEKICDTWYPSVEGIVLVYQTYSIGPGASGTIEVLVPYAELDGLLGNILTSD